MDHSISVLGLVGGIPHFYSSFNRIVCVQTVEHLIDSAASDLGLHCSPMSQDARLTLELIILGSIMTSCLIWDYTVF